MARTAAAPRASRSNNLSEVAQPKAKAMAAPVMKPVGVKPKAPLAKVAKVAKNAKAGKKTPAAKPLSQAALERIKDVVGAHALLRQIGQKLEELARLRPMQDAPKGTVKLPAVSVDMPRALYERSRIARGTDRKTWRKSVASSDAGTQKRRALEQAKVLHAEAFRDEANLEEVSKWAKVPQVRRRAYLDAVAIAAEKKADKATDADAGGKEAEE
eukprot:CAMPEP_0180025040 /NCGR_PEP_ID=MMETSP0984-20121128/24415_1 /TAXON_ID=483367 /ORGANISM="non described non described, Strain CCMP 2436" /LENGTH=213 /DNA_ID=CAMNT_0021949589 /DNA_START=23 /DNA_END=661 /DNA_ORIENTATION=-